MNAETMECALMHNYSHPLYEVQVISRNQSNRLECKHKT